MKTSDVNDFDKLMVIAHILGMESIKETMMINKKKTNHTKLSYSQSFRHK